MMPALTITYFAELLSIISIICQWRILFDAPPFFMRDSSLPLERHLYFRRFSLRLAPPTTNSI